jgi:hypothetical protein
VRSDRVPSMRRTVAFNADPARVAKRTLYEISATKSPFVSIIRRMSVHNQDRFAAITRLREHIQIGAV